MVGVDCSTRPVKVNPGQFGKPLGALVTSWNKVTEEN